MENKEIVKQLENYREKKGWTKTKMATEIGIPQSTYSDYANHGNCTPKTLAKAKEYVEKNKLYFENSKEEEEPKQDKVLIDFDKLCCSLEEKGYNLSSMSTLTGKSVNYLSQKKMDKSKFDKNYEKLLCVILGHEEGYFIKEEPAQTATCPNVDLASIDLDAFKNDILTNFDDAVTSINMTLSNLLKHIEELEYQVENLNKRTNSMNVVLLKTKELVDISVENHKSDRDRAITMINDLMSDSGMAYVDEVMKIAAERGISKDAVMSAKKQMKLNSVTTPCGKTTRVVWKK